MMVKLLNLIIPRWPALLVSAIWETVLVYVSIETGWREPMVAMAMVLIPICALTIWELGKE